ncbi:hypothetical protein FHS16_001243 [Paenibacillus endophyticus]|uniref:Uncharacterized protein n=1 Tax=Paenibacillus endophyticus TaxID=1294268 RepID=A0A7W5C5K1_9BACL|nr:hypothetical protein [Paenibacillus endophyticus]
MSSEGHGLSKNNKKPKSNGCPLGITDNLGFFKNKGD